MALSCGAGRRNGDLPFIHSGSEGVCIKKYLLISVVMRISEKLRLKAINNVQLFIHILHYLYFFLMPNSISRFGIKFDLLNVLFT